MLVYTAQYGLRIANGNFSTQYFKSIVVDFNMIPPMARWRLKSPVSLLFIQTFVQAKIKKTIKAPRHWPLCGKIHQSPVNSPHKWPVTRKCFNLMTSSWDEQSSAGVVQILTIAVEVRYMELGIRENISMIFKIMIGHLLINIDKAKLLFHISRKH